MDSPTFQILRDRIPAALLPAARGVYYGLSRVLREIRYFRAGLFDDSARKAAGIDKVPPPPLRYRVSGMMDLAEFLGSGRAALNDLDSVLEKAGTSFRNMKDILDFGCGCGRVALWVMKTYPHIAFSGCDTDPEGVKWAQDNLRDGTFKVNAPRPPTPYAEGSFDLVYALSVLTHLDEAYHHAWLAEWRRIVRPGGLVLATVHGAPFSDQLPPAQKRELEEKGFLHLYDYGMQGIFPDFYQVAYHTRPWVERIFAQYFEIVAYLPRAMTSQQDMVVMRRPG